MLAVALIFFFKSHFPFGRDMLELVGQLVEPVQTGGLLELFYPFVGVCVRGVAVFKVT